MKTHLALAVVLSLGAPAFGHRLDEYLQATIISLEKDHVEVSMRLVPGVAVSSTVLAGLQTNRDGVISEIEQRAYAQQVLGDLSLSVDDVRVQTRLLSVHFPTIQKIKEGIGEIQIELSADLPAGRGTNRKLVLENHHQSSISAYLVNCLVPGDRHTGIVAQNRNANQSFYELDFVQGDVGVSNPREVNWWSEIRSSFGKPAALASMFRLGIRHIAEGTDHLLFLLALLLPAPLLVSASSWAGSAGVRHSLLQILKVVTAFTLGHSITLALAALALVHIPGRPVEVLIAVSILVSAIHALRPIFPGREPVIAAFFGLIHGLAFAATLSQLGLGRWERVAGILAFNLGIETMQLVVVGVTMPSLILLSQTRAYSPVRVGGSLFAALASAGWIAERLLGVNFSVNVLMNNVAHRAVWIAGSLFLVSFVCWLMTKTRNNENAAAKNHSPELAGACATFPRAI